MKILQVSPKYYPSIGGLEEHVKNISERLAKEHEVAVFACDPSGKLQREEEINGVLVRRFKSFSPGDAYHISFEMAKELRKCEFDIVHGHNYHAFPLYVSRHAKARRFVVTPHYHGHGHTAVRNFFIKLYKPFGKRIFEDADSIIAVSNYEKKLLVENFNLRESKISLISNGVDLSEFSDSESIQKEPETILYIGRLEEYKGVQYIIEALPLLDKGFYLKIVGKGPYKANLTAQIDKLGLNDRVRFYQDLPRQELLQMYTKAGVFVLLSQYEAFSIVVAEALAAKTPCIVANTSALSEWVDNKNCFGVDYPTKVDKLVEVIGQVAGTEVGGAKVWDWNEVVADLTQLYKGN